MKRGSIATVVFLLVTFLISAAVGINYPGDSDTMNNVNGGRVRIDVDPPSEKLSVNGTVESTSGRFRFPDGTQLH